MHSLTDYLNKEDIDLFEEVINNSSKLNDAQKQYIRSVIMFYLR
jgi:hypothetical protein